MSLSLRPVWLFPLALILTGAACPAKQVSPAAGEPGTPSGNAGSGGSVTPPGGGAPPPRDPDPSQACAEEAHRAEMVPLDLMMVVDSSGSMNEFAGRKTKWELATTALSAFVRDPRYAGLGIGLQFFPLGYPKACTTDADCISFATTSNGSLCQQVTHFCVGPEGLVPGVGSLLCEPQSPAGSFRPGYPDCPTGTTCLPIGNCAGSGARCANIGQACPLSGGMCLAEKACWETIPRPECEIARYEKPTVPIDTLPMSEMALTAALRAWSPMGGTPMGPAVRGAISYLRTRLAANPGRKAALVLVGDGLPDGCARVAEGEPGMNDIPAIATILGDAFMASPSIPTYVIGVFALGDLVLSGEEMDRLAMAGGTNQAYVLNAAGDLAQRLHATLEEIRGAASLACEFAIPPPRMGTTGAIDFSKVNVRYTGPAGPENIPYVERADRCDPLRGGWYYDVEPARGTPQRVQVCEATCRRFKTEANARVDLLFGCARVIL